MSCIENKKTIYDDEWKWSYSQLNSFCTCKYMFYKHYIEHCSNINNAFSQFGSFVHSIMEKYGNGELELFELSNYYSDNYYNNILLKFPISKYCDMDDLYYTSGLKYFNSFNGFKDYTVACEYKIDGYIEIKNHKKRYIGGIIDRIAKDENGNILLYDYKSKSTFKNKSERDKYFRQLYLYAYLYWKKENVIPTKLRFILIRSKTKEKQIVETDFDFCVMQNVINWCINTIEEILSCEDWEQNDNEFFCKSLCSLTVFDCDNKYLFEKFDY